MTDTLLSVHQEIFGQAAEWAVKAPGRANLIGEHTDYNRGYVLPFALERACYLVGSRRTDGQAHIHARDLGQVEQVPIALTDAPLPTDWTRYAVSALQTLQRHGYKIGGINCLISSEIPLGAGLSSSSALTCGFLGLLNALFGLQLSGEQLVRLASEAENGTGVAGGMMDQYAIIFSSLNRALLLDCDTLTHQEVPLHLSGFQWIFVNSHVKHSLIDTEYSARRRTCEAGLARVQRSHSEVRSVRGLDFAHLALLADDARTYQCLRYVLEENERVLAMVNALHTHDIERIGALLYASHWGLSHAYRVSCPELDFLVNAARTTEGVVGARMMGGGFGGGIIALVEVAKAASAAESILWSYHTSLALEGEWYALQSADGMRAWQV